MDQYHPLTSVIMKALADKTYEKRKVAATEIEKIVRSYCNSNDNAAISKIINVLARQTPLDNLNAKKGMLMGLAGVAIGLGPDHISPFIVELTSHIFPCFDDTTGNVRYYAAEALHNICRAAKVNILPMFNSIFQVILSLSVDDDNNVRGAAEVLDRGLKDIVTLSREFDLVGFAPQLRDKLYLRHDETQHIVISWITVLLGIPDVDLLPLLPEIIDGIFVVLNSKREEVKDKAEHVLAELLALIQTNPQKVKFTEMIHIITVHAQSKNPHVKAAAIMWILKFIQLSKRRMLPNIASILVAIIPCLALQDERSSEIRTLAEQCSSLLSELISPEDDEITSDEDFNITSDPMNLESALNVLLVQINEESNLCKLCALRWVFHLIDKLPKHTRIYVDFIFEGVLKSLHDPCDEVVMLALQILAQIASSDFYTENKVTPKKENVKIKPHRKLHCGFYFTQFLRSLLQMFKDDREVLKERGPYIIRQLCVMLPVENVYWMFAELLGEEQDLIFACEMVRNLSLILLTSQELSVLRLQLRRMETEEDGKKFERLYRSWCHSPVATLTLCLLAECYDHASDIIHIFGNMDVTTNFLLELDRLIQSFESPVFAFLRMKLLRPQEYPALVETLYGILMLIPQTGRFQLLSKRLQCVPHTLLAGGAKKRKTKETKDFINFKTLLEHFESMVEKHEQYNHRTMQQKLLNLTLEIGSFE